MAMASEEGRKLKRIRKVRDVDPQTALAGDLDQIDLDTSEQRTRVDASPARNSESEEENLTSGSFSEAHSVRDEGNQGLKRKLGEDEDAYFSDNEGKRSSAEQPEVVATTSGQKCRRSTKKALDDIHAESQRLLRETTEVAFEVAPVVRVPMTGLIAKLRARKAELGWKDSDSKEHDSVTMEDVAGDILNVNGNEEDTKDRKGDATARVMLDEDSEEEAALFPSWETAQEKISIETSSTLRQALDNTQDLFGDSQVENELQEDDDDYLTRAPSLNLHLDSEPQDDVEGSEPENKHKGVHPIPYKPPIMALVDCEAEDEDEDILANDSEEEENEENDVDEMIEPAKPEAAADISKREELHRRWLEQQDEVETDDILCRLIKPNGVQNDVPSSVLDDPEELVASENLVRREKKASVFDELLNGDKHLLQTKVHEKTFQEESDDEETERQILRQRLLETADEHEVFSSAAEDESSRSMLGFIKKLNVPVAAKAKPVQASAGGYKKPKPAFLNRAVSSNSLKQTNTNSRSFVFGRDDSNSSSGLSHKEPTCKTDVSNTKCTQSSAGKGPSLFSILRQQAGDFQQSNRAVVTDKISIFAKVSSKKNKLPRV